jgi:hypothetical protein
MASGTNKPMRSNATIGNFSRASKKPRGMPIAEAIADAATPRVIVFSNNSRWRASERRRV